MVEFREKGLGEMGGAGKWGCRENMVERGPRRLVSSLMEKVADSLAATSRALAP